MEIGRVASSGRFGFGKEGWYAETGIILFAVSKYDCETKARRASGSLLTTHSVFS